MHIVERQGALLCDGFTCKCARILNTLRINNVFEHDVEGKFKRRGVFAAYSPSEFCELGHCGNSFQVEPYTSNSGSGTICTPPAWQEKLNCSPAVARVICGFLRLAKIIHSPDFKRRLSGEGGEPVASTPEDFAALIKVATVRWGKVIKAARILSE